MNEELSPYSEGQEAIDAIHIKLELMKEICGEWDVESQCINRLVFIGLLTEIKAICEIKIDEFLEV